MSSVKKTQYQTRSKAAKAAVAKTTPTDWKNSKSAYTSTSNYKPRTDVSYSKKYSPAERDVYRQRYNNTYNGYYYNDPYDHAMIWGFSSLWWYHHWDSIDRTHYANDARMRQLEAEVAMMRSQGIAANPNYLDPNMNESVMYSNGYLNGVKNNSLVGEPMPPVERTFVPDSHHNNEDTAAIVFFWILGIMVAVVIVGGVIAAIND